MKQPAEFVATPQLAINCGYSFTPTSAEVVGGEHKVTGRINGVTAVLTYPVLSPVTQERA